MYRSFEFRFDAARKCQINGELAHHGKTFIWKLTCRENYEAFQEKGQRINAMFHNNFLNTLYIDCDDESLINRIYLELKEIGEHSLTLQTSYGALHYDGTFTKVQIDKVISCAHFLPNVEDGHKCGYLHGHDFGISVLLLLAPKGDLHELVDFISEKIEAMENRLLNDIKGLENPTSENFAKWIYYKHRSKLHNILEVTVTETKTAGSSFDGSQKFKLRKSFDMECAIPYEKTFSGHSYQVILGIVSEIDKHAGWSIDFGDVKASFKDDYKALDHHELGEVLQLETVGNFDLAKYIFEQMKPKLSILTFVEVRDQHNNLWNYQPW